MSTTDSEGSNSNPFARFFLRGDIPPTAKNEIKACGIRLPSGRIVVEWRRDAWPEDKRLEGYHQSEYDSLEDLEQATTDDIEWLDGRESTKYGGQL